MESFKNNGGEGGFDWRFNQGEVEHRPSVENLEAELKEAEEGQAAIETEARAKAMEVAKLQAQLDAAKGEFATSVDKVKAAKQKVEEKKKEIADRKAKEVQTWLDARGMSAEEYKESLLKSISDTEAERRLIEERARYNPEFKDELMELDGDLGEMKRKVQMLEDVIALGTLSEEVANEGLASEEAVEEEEPAEEEVAEEFSDEEAQEETVGDSGEERAEAAGEKTPIVFPVFDEEGPLGDETQADEEGEETVEAVVEAEAEGVEMSAEEKERVAKEVKEKLKKRKGEKFKRIVSVALVAVILAAMIFISGCSPKKNAQPAETEQAQTQVGVNLDSEDLGVTAEDFGEKDDRQEAANGTRHNYEDYASRLSREDYESGKYTKEQLDAMGKKLSYNAFGTNSERFFGDRGGAVQDILDACKDAPEILAAHVSYFPEVLAKCGLDGKSANEIDELLSEKDGGGELQEKLLEAYAEVLQDEKTVFDFYYEENSEQSYYMYFIDDNGDGEMAPDEIHLASALSQRNHAPQVRISHDGASIDLNMRCRWQPNQENEIQGVERIETRIIEDETPTTSSVSVTPSETTPVTPPETAPDTPETPQETPLETEEIEKKNPENEQRIVGDFEDSDDAAGKVTPTASEDIGEVTSQPESQSGNEAAASGEASNGSYSPEEAEAAQEAQEEANANEDTTPMSDDEFDDFMRQFNLGQ